MIDKEQVVNFEEIVSWGLLTKIKRERIIDSFIVNISDPNEEEISDIKKNWSKQLQFKNADEFKKWQKINGFTPNTFEKYLIRIWKWSIYCNDYFADDLESYYLQKKEHLDEISFMLIRVSNKNLADEIYLRISEGEDTFSNLAEKFSEGPEKKMRGFVGPLKVIKLHPELSKNLLTFKKDQLNTPLEIDNNFFITKLIEKKISKFNDQIRNSLSLELGEKLILEKLNN